MKITAAGWLVVAAYFLFNLLIGLYYRRKGTGSTDDYFVSGRNVSWWLAGTSMVAATFAADTPLAVTGLVATQGIAGNWLWWGLLFSGMMTVFFLGPSLAAGGDRHGRPIRRVALFRQARSISSWIPRRLLWHPDELSDPGLGESGHGKDSDDGAGGYGILGDCHYFRHHCFHRPLYYPLRALGRSLDRFFPVHS